MCCIGGMVPTSSLTFGSPKSDQDMWLTSSPDVAQTYADARPGNGVVTPLRTNADKDIGLAYVRGDGKRHDRVTSNAKKIPGIQSGFYKGTDDIAKAVKESGEYTGTVFKKIRDEFSTDGSTPYSDVYNILGSRPDVNIRHADAAYDPQYSGPNIMGGLLAGGVGLGALSQSEDADAAGFITRGGKTLLEAWHGSPHKFDKFSMDQIGTGEGAQAYGHGLYFADSEDVARQYRDTLSLNGYQDNNANYSKALELGLSAGEFDRFEGMVRMAATKNGLDTGRISKDLQEYLQWPDDSMPALESFVGEYLDTLPKGALYRTEIGVTPESLLDWDAMLDEQPKAVQEAIESTDWWDYAADDLWNGADNPTGGSLVRWLSDDGPEFGSQQLNDAGIKGIKYLDGDSRAVGDGTSNYVIFDDSLINIAEEGQRHGAGAWCVGCWHRRSTGRPCTEVRGAREGHRIP